MSDRDTVARAEYERLRAELDHHKRVAVLESRIRELTEELAASQRSRFMYRDIARAVGRRISEELNRDADPDSPMAYCAPTDARAMVLALDKLFARRARP